MARPKSPVVMMTLTCANADCGVQFERDQQVVLRQRRMGKHRDYCSQACYLSTSHHRMRLGYRIAPDGTDKQFESGW